MLEQIEADLATALAVCRDGTALEQDSKRLNQKGDSPIYGFVIQDAGRGGASNQRRNAGGRVYLQIHVLNLAQGDQKKPDFSAK